MNRITRYDSFNPYGIDVIYPTPSMPCPYINEFIDVIIKITNNFTDAEQVARVYKLYPKYIIDLAEQEYRKIFYPNWITLTTKPNPTYIHPDGTQVCIGANGVITYLW